MYLYNHLHANSIFSVLGLCWAEKSRDTPKSWRTNNFQKCEFMSWYITSTWNEWTHLHQQILKQLLGRWKIPFVTQEAKEWHKHDKHGQTPKTFWKIQPSSISPGSLRIQFFPFQFFTFEDSRHNPNPKRGLNGSNLYFLHEKHCKENYSTIQAASPLQKCCNFYQNFSVQVVLPCTRLKDKAKAVQSSWLPFSRARFTSASRRRAPDQTRRKVFRISCIHVRSVYSLQWLHLNCKICGSIAVCISYILSLTYKFDRLNELLKS